MSVAPPNLARLASQHGNPTGLAGTRVGRYEILTQIASGGMATVYLARALGAGGFQRLVAIKALHAHVADDEVFTSMFMDEARLAARIRHPNVVPTLDLENGADGLFLVMEFVEGDSLVGLVRALARAQQPLAPAITLRVMLDVLAGLRAAHELTDDEGELLNLVHRDVSPHNILLGVDGITKITDFGVARANARIGITREGQIKGKLSYMAPEQTTGDPVDARADIFSAGIVLWECLAGKRLFQADTDGAVVRKLIDMPIPRLREVAPEYPAQLDEVCAKALARNVDERYSTAAEFAEALEAAAEPIGISTQRQVGALVRELVAPKLAALRGSVRPSASVPAAQSSGSGAPAAAGSSGSNRPLAASGSHPQGSTGTSPSGTNEVSASAFLDTTPLVEDAATSLRELPAPQSSSDAGMIVPLVRSASLPPPAPVLTPPTPLLPIVYPRPSRQFGWPVAVGLVLIGMVGVLIVAFVQRAGAPKDGSPSASSASTASSAKSAPEARGVAIPTASGQAITSAVATSDAVPVEKLEKLPAAGRNTGRVVPPHATAPRIAPVPPRPRPTGTGGGDSFDPESL
ncbi:MAG: Protein kinase [Myxococcaceae bacterium]|nr:Protein kinase [Myxococcaceae bacterium]